MTNVDVRSFLAKHVEELWGVMEVTAAEAVGRLGALARADVALLFDDQDQLLPVRQWPAWMRPAVLEVDRAAGRVKMVNPLPVLTKVLELTGRLKNPQGEVGDVLAEALRRDIERHGSHQ